jgi:hypothetical protein
VPNPTPESPERGYVPPFSNVFPNKAEPPAEAPEKPLAPYSCSGCDNRWSGISRCHCAGCHRTFSGYVLFDGHRRDIKGVGTCIDPAGNDKLKFEGGIWRSAAEFDTSKIFR